jgi:hypothetical protein
MSSIPLLLRQLEAYVQEEIGAQGRTLVLLAAQEEALRTGEPRKIAAATLHLEHELQSIPARTRRRTQLLDGLARTWNAAAGALTLSSVVERAAGEGERLGRQRTELRELVAKVTRQTRRIAATARFHGRFTTEVLQTLLAIDGAAPIEAGGVLVDAEA